MSSKELDRLAVVRQVLEGRLTQAKAGEFVGLIATWTLVRGRRKRRVTFAPRLYMGEFFAAHRAVLAGVGIAMFPEVHCAEDVAKKRLVRVLEGYEGESGGVHLLYRAHRSLTAAVRTCIDHFLAELPATDPSRADQKRLA
jgi:DNA-binding transcriptional LysR family regulator